MIDRVKFTKEFSVNGMSEWVGMEGSVDPGQTPEQLLNEITGRVMEWRKWKGVNQVTEELPVIQIGDESRDEILKNIKR